jgi:hypothetical protein
MRVTTDDLRAMGACAKAAETFAAEWPDGCDITAATLARAEAIGFDLWWCGSRVFSDRPEWDALVARYRQEQDTLNARYRPAERDASDARFWQDYDACFDALDQRYRVERDTLILRLAAGEEERCE